MIGPVEQSTNPAQLSVAHARAQVLDGRGRDAIPDEQAHAQHDRDLLGALPAPIERELVALAAEIIRITPQGPILDTLRERFERLYKGWQPASDSPPMGRLTPAWTDSADITSRGAD